LTIFNKIFKNLPLLFKKWISPIIGTAAQQDGRNFLV